MNQKDNPNLSEGGKVSELDQEVPETDNDIEESLRTPANPHFKEDPWSRRRYTSGINAPLANREYRDHLRTFGGRGYTAHRRDVKGRRLFGYAGMQQPEE